MGVYENRWKYKYTNKVCTAKCVLVKTYCWFCYMSLPLFGGKKNPNNSWMPLYKRQSLNLTSDFCNTFLVTYFTEYLPWARCNLTEDIHFIYLIAILCLSSLLLAFSTTWLIWLWEGIGFILGCASKMCLKTNKSVFVHFSKTCG